MGFAIKFVHKFYVKVETPYKELKMWDSLLYTMYSFSIRLVGIDRKETI